MKILILVCALVAAEAAKLQGYSLPNGQAPTALRASVNSDLSSSTSSRFSNPATLPSDRPLSATNGVTLHDTNTASSAAAIGVPLPTASGSQLPANIGQSFAAPSHQETFVAIDQPATQFQTQQVSQDSVQRFSQSSGVQHSEISAFSGQDGSGSSQQVLSGLAQALPSAPAFAPSVQANQHISTSSAPSFSDFSNQELSTSQNEQITTQSANLQSERQTQSFPDPISQSFTGSSRGTLPATSQQSFSSSSGQSATSSASFPQPQPFSTSLQTQREQFQDPITSARQHTFQSAPQAPIEPATHRSSAPPNRSYSQASSQLGAQQFSSEFSQQSLSGSHVPTVSDANNLSLFVTSGQSHAAPSDGVFSSSAVSEFSRDSSQSVSTSSNIGLPASLSSQDISEECPEGEVLHVDGRCVVPEVIQNYFVYAAPKQDIRLSAVAKDIPLPKVEHNIVFIRAPEYGSGQEPIIIPPPQLKNIIYVLQKESEYEGQRIIEVTTPKAGEPEVYFVNYAEGENPTLPDGIDFETALQSAIEADGQVISGSQHIEQKASDDFLNNQEQGIAFSDNSGLTFAVDVRTSPAAETPEVRNFEATIEDNFRINQNGTPLGGQVSPDTVQISTNTNNNNFNIQSSGTFSSTDVRQEHFFVSTDSEESFAENSAIGDSGVPLPGVGSNIPTQSSSLGRFPTAGTFNNAREEHFFTTTESEESFLDNTNNSDAGVPLPGLTPNVIAQGTSSVTDRRATTGGARTPSRLYNTP